MKLRTLLLLALITVSCGEPIRFEAPQPEGHSNEKGIPKRLIGQYLGFTDSSKLTITNRLIIKCVIEDFSDTIDSTDLKQINGDTVYAVVDENMKFDIVVEGDSTFQRWSYYDTLFDAARGDLLRKYKGHYFLNKKVSADSWQVTTLTRIGTDVTLGKISTKEDIGKLRELTGTKSDSAFSFRPTKKELRKFLNKNGFGDKNTFIKIE